MSMAVEVYGLRLGRAFPGRLIQPDDQNLLVDFWLTYRRHLDLLVAAGRVPSEVGDLASKLGDVVSRMRRVKVGDFVLADDFNTHREAAEIGVEVSKLICQGRPELAPVCSELEALLSSLPVVRGGDVITSAGRNTLLDIVERLHRVASAAGWWVSRVLVHLLPTGLGDDPWDAIRPFLRDNVVIFLPFNVPGLTGGQLKPILDAHSLVVVNTVDTEPGKDGVTQTFYQLLYSQATVKGDWVVMAIPVVDSCLRGWVGDLYPHLWDYLTVEEVKLPGFTRWLWTADYPRGSFAYVRHGRGAAVEVPFDGMWRTSTQLMRTVYGIAACLIGEVEELDIVYASHYTSDMPQWHACHPVDTCWREVCGRLGWTLIDER